MKQFISYRVDLMKSTTKGKYCIWINPMMKNNVEANKKTGHRRFYCNDRAYKKLREFFDEQWQNNIKN